MFRNTRRSSNQEKPHKNTKPVSVRSQSLPPSKLEREARRKSILRYGSVDDSIHSTYGESKRSEERRDIRLKYKNIEIREYARTIGDNPSCSSGPPISIGWAYAEAKVLPLDVYENSRPPRRSNIEMILPRDLRQRMLRKDWDITQSQIAAAVRANIKVKNQRRTTVQNLGKSTKMEEAMENASKGMSGLFGRGTDRKVKKLEEQAKKAEAARKQKQLNGQMADEPETTAPMEEADGGDHSDGASASTIGSEEAKRSIVAHED